MELLAQILRHPAQKDEGDRVGPEEGDDQDHGARRFEELSQELHQGNGRRIGRVVESVGLEPLCFVAGRLPQEDRQHDRQYDAANTKQLERRLPAVLTRQVSGERGAADCSRVDARLMQAHRPRSSSQRVIIADERHRRGEIERFTQTFRRPHNHKLDPAATKAGCPRHHTPNRQSAQDQRLAAIAIAHLAGKRRLRA